METYTFSHAGIQVTVKPGTLEENSQVTFLKDGISNEMTIKGHRLTNKGMIIEYGRILKDQAGKVIFSSSHELTAPFEDIFNSVVNGSLGPAIHRKHINCLVMGIFGVYCFTPEGAFMQPVDIELSCQNESAAGAADGSVLVNVIAGSEYTDLQYSIQKGADTQSAWQSSPDFHGLSAAIYTVYVQRSGAVLPSIPKKQIEIGINE